MHVIIHIDGGSRGNPGPAGAGVIMTDPDGTVLFEGGFFLGRTTNNVAEYTALIRALELAQRLKTAHATIISDSELLVRQINGDYRVKNEGLKSLFDDAYARLKKLQRWTVKHVRREENHRADALANLAMDKKADVIEFELLAAGPAGNSAIAGAANAPAARSPRLPSPPTAKSARAARRAQSSNQAIATCKKTPDPLICPAPCTPAQAYQLADSTPAGICLKIAADLIRSAEAVQREGQPAIVTCPLRGCGAQFEIRST